MAVSTVTDCPALTPSLVGGSAAAWAEKSTLEFIDSRPLFSASNTR